MSRHLAVFYTSEHAEIFAAAVYYEHVCGSVKLAVAVASARRLNHAVEPRAEPYHAAERYINARFYDLRRDATTFGASGSVRLFSSALFISDMTVILCAMHIPAER